MLLLRDVIGQNNPVRYLSGSLSSGRVSASYLFSGPCGVGRALTAKAFLRELLFPVMPLGEESARLLSDIRKLDKMEHPDVMWIVPEKNRNIGIDEIRKVKDLLYMKPFSSSRNAAVIEDAHMMSREASNALLKVLEEPPENSVIILISDKKELLPDTVLSRCSDVRFSRLSRANVKRVIMDHSQADEKTAELLAGLCQGSAGLALERMKDGFDERRNMLDKTMAELTGRSADVFMGWHSESKDALIEDIDAVVIMLRDALISGEGFLEPILGGDPGKGTDGWSICEKTADEIYRSMERLSEIKKALRGNVNAKLISQALPFVISGHES